MKKVGGMLVVLMLLLISFSFVVASNHTNGSTETNFSTGENFSVDDDASEIEQAFACLQTELKSDCSGADSIQEIALSILASPEDVTDDCVARLESLKQSENCWGENSCDIRDTALAILALDHAKKDTTASEDWLLSKNITSSNLIWYLQQDSNVATQCKISYDSNDYTVNVAANKKIDSSAGSCLSLANSNFWWQISSNCHNTEFSISCDEDFVASLLYKQPTSDTVYVLSETPSAPAFDTIELGVRSQCFGDGSCNYEDTAWATLALLETGHDIEDFVPYLVALEDSNERYLPLAFIFMITEYQDYGTRLVQEQELGNFWLADSSFYNKYYDTALALLSLTGSSAEQVDNAENWLFFSQESNGCWNNGNIRDTAMILWAVEGRSASVSVSSGGTTYCADAGFFCIPSSECPAEQTLGNYFCSGLNKECCQTENLLTCDAYGGEVCSGDLVCDGNERGSSDSGACCLGSCVEPTVNTLTQCETEGYICKSSCSENQEEAGFACSSSQICCKASTTSDEGGSLWWLWLIIILMLIALVVVAIIFRDKLKVAYFKVKSKFGKDKGNASAQNKPRPGMPPRPGFPPIRRSRPIMPPARGRARPSSRTVKKKDNELDDVFSKLKKIGS